VNIEGFRHLCEVTLYTGDNTDWKPQSCGDVEIGVDHGILKMSIKGDTTPEPVPMGTLLNNLSPASAHELPDEKLTLDYQHGTRVFRILFKEVSLQNESEGVRMSSAHFYLLEK
jgi:hypothetical protein